MIPYIYSGSGPAMLRRPLYRLAGILLIAVSSQALAWTDSTLFSPKLFIENKGQFNNIPYLKQAAPVLFGMNHSHNKIFFSANSLDYVLLRVATDEKAFREFQEEESK